MFWKLLFLAILALFTPCAATGDLPEKNFEQSQASMGI